MADKKIYIKEHNSLFDSPEPLFEEFQYVSGNYGQAYHAWLSSKVEVVGDHTWVDGQEVKEGIDYVIKEIGILTSNDEGEEITVAIPKEKDNDVTSQQQPSTPVVSLTASSGNSVEHLLKPRYKVIAKMPLLPFGLGEIHNADFIPVTVLGQEVYVRLDLYPHLFKKLQWWEERTPKEMPKYLRFVRDYMGHKKGSVYEYSDWNKELDSDGCIGFITESGEYDKAAVPPTYNQLMPATKEEYDRFMLNNVQNVQECDARESEQSDTDGSQKK